MPIGNWRRFVRVSGTRRELEGDRASVNGALSAIRGLSRGEVGPICTEGCSRGAWEGASSIEREFSVGVCERVCACGQA